MSLKVQQCSSENNVQLKQDVQIHKDSPAFKAGIGDAAFNIAGNIMQGVQNSGFLASFLIQDGLGMTAPRVATAYLRDKEVTGEYNFQEGEEVLLREGLTGPIMMAVAPLALLLSAKFGKSTTINSQLIKRYGNSFKEILSKPDFKKDLLNKKFELKEKYYEHNIRSMLENTLGKNNYKDEDVKFILEQIKKYENPPEKPDVKGMFKKKKYKSQCLGEIESRINNMKYNTSSELDMLNKVKIGNDKTIRPYNTREAIEALVKYGDDVITNNKHLSEMTAEASEKFMDKSIAKRIITTIVTIFSTIGVMSVIPKIYAKSDISPGAKTAMQMKETHMHELEEEQKKDDNKTKNVAFKGKGGKGGKDWLSAFGKFIRKHQNENFSSELEYDGHNFTNTLFTGLSLFGLLLPRGLRAYNRAQIDDDGKRDLTELYEILIRDLSSSLSVIFAVPMLTRVFVTSYEHHSGFVLMNKDRDKSKSQTIIDLINPYSKSHVLSNKEIESLYFGVDNKEKMVNFCEYINKNHGDLQKIFAKSENANEIFNDKSFKLSDIENLSKQEKNSKILEYFKNAGGSDAEKQKLDAAIKKMMQGAESKIKGNKLLSFVKGLNSMPAFITTFVISPILLGWFIPRITYVNTRRIHEKKEKQSINKTA